MRAPMIESPSFSGMKSWLPVSYSMHAPALAALDVGASLVPENHPGPVLTLVGQGLGVLAQPVAPAVLELVAGEATQVLHRVFVVRTSAGSI